MHLLVEISNGTRPLAIFLFCSKAKKKKKRKRKTIGTIPLIPVPARLRRCDASYMCTREDIVRLDKAGLLSALRAIRRQSDLLLLLASFQKLKKYAQQKHQRTHFKRCAALLKHQAVKKTATVHFLRWLSITQRRTSMRPGHCELTKIVALPRNQDFIQLSIRYFSQWRRWIRRVRQRKQKNVLLLSCKITDKVRQGLFFKWQCFLLRHQKEKLKTDLCRIQDHNKHSSDYVAKLETELKQQQDVIKNLEKSEQRLRTKNMEQQREIEELYGLIKTASKKLGNTGTVDVSSMTHSADEKIAHCGEDVPRRLLTDCETTAKAIERLRETLPNDMAPLEGSEAILDAVFLHVAEMSKRSVLLQNELHSTKSVAVFLRDVVGEVTSRLMSLVNATGVSVSHLSVDTTKKDLHPLLHWGSKGEVCTLQNSLDQTGAIEAVRNHLENEHGLTEKGPLTVSVLRSLDDAMSQMNQTLARRAELCVQQKDASEREGREKEVLAAAARGAVAALQGWSTAPAEGTGENLDVLQLAANLRRESGTASNTLACLRELLINDTPAPDETRQNDVGELHSDKMSSVGPHSIVTHDDLVRGVQGLKDQLKEVNRVHDEIYGGLCCHVPDSPTRSSTINTDESVSFSLPLTSLQRNPVKRVEAVALAVRSYVCRKREEVKGLRDVMLRCMKALSGDDNDASADVDDSIETSAAIGERLALLCSDTGGAIEAAMRALGMPKEKKLKLSDAIPSLRHKMRELEAVTEESVAMVKDVCGTPSEGSRERSSTGLQCLKPKRKPAALVKGEESDGIELVKVSPITISPCSSNSTSFTDKLDKLHHQLKEEMREKTSEMRDLLEVCQTVVSLLNGSYKENAEPARYGNMLRSLLAAQAEDLRRVLQSVRATLADETLGNSSVGNHLTVLASRLASVRAANATLEKELERRNKQIAQLTNGFKDETCRLNKLNDDLKLKVTSLEEQVKARDQLRQLRAEAVMQIFRLQTVKRHLGKRFMVWLLHLSSVRSKKLRASTSEQDKLLSGIVQKQCQQNCLVKSLAVVLHTLPGKTPQDVVDVLSTENLLRRLVQEKEGAALETLVQERTRAARKWLRSLGSLVSAAASLRSDTAALRQLVANTWDEKLRGVCCQLLTDTFAAVTASNKRKELEYEFLRRSALDREALVCENRKLWNDMSNLQRQLVEEQQYTSLQEGHIIKLRRENRDLQLGNVMRGAGDDICTSLPAVTAPCVTQLTGEFAVVANAKRLALEAINAMAGRDLAACIGEVAELTLEMYRRTTAVLEELCETWKTSTGLLPAEMEARLQELRNMCDVRNEIVARLPKLFRMPFVD